VNIAEGGLQEVSSLLTELQGLLTNSASSAGLSAEEKNANQLQIDSIIQTIDRVAAATTFQGIKLLNGNFDFKVSGLGSGVTDYRVNSAKFNGASLNVDVQVTNSAQQAGIFLSLGGSSLALATGSSLVLEIVGSKGSRELTFSSTQTLATIRSTINTFKDITGVEASTSGTGIKLFSSDFGSAEFVTVRVAAGSGTLTAGSSGIRTLANQNFNNAATGTGTSETEFSAASNGVTDRGQDIGATINGVRATAAGKTLRVNSDFLDVELTLSQAESQALGGVDGVGGSGTSAFAITGGGATFQLAGRVDIGGKVSMGIQDIAVRKLGNSNIGFLDRLGSGKANNVASGDVAGGQKIVSEAIKQVSSLRGRLGAFQRNTVGATIRSLGVAVENTAAAQSLIRDADFAAETAALTRSQILVSASTNILSLANQQPNAALQLLG